MLYVLVLYRARLKSSEYHPGSAGRKTYGEGGGGEFRLLEPLWLVTLSGVRVRVGPGLEETTHPDST